MERETAVDIGTLITSEPDFRLGRPFIAGTRRSVQSIAWMYRDNRDAEAIARALPEIPKASIYAALTYYLANQAQIDQDVQDDADLYHELYAADVARRGAPVAAR